MPSRDILMIKFYCKTGYAYLGDFVAKQVVIIYCYYFVLVLVSISQTNYN